REVLLRLRPDAPLPDWASDHMTRERQRQLMSTAAPVYGVPTSDFDTGVILMSERRAHIAIIVEGWAITARRGGGVVAMRPWDYVQHFGDLQAYTWRT
ncbi:MAG TPA: hypothetical protein VN680_06370, partial [Burkholderiaceae bacterium]|nr:hypothetical protein [Burkholderiaceae bacterium]